MIESRSQVGHRRRMALSQSLAQSVSSLCSGAESGIKRIVVHWGSAAGVDLPRSEPEAEVLLLNKSSTAQYWNPVWAVLEADMQEAERRRVDVGNATSGAGLPTASEGGSRGFAGHRETDWPTRPGLPICYARTKTRSSGWRRCP